MDRIKLLAIATALPFWWGMGLLVLALLGDVSAWWHPRVSRFFARLERVGRVTLERTVAYADGSEKT